MSIYERYFDKTKCMYFTIKDEKLFDKYMKITEKVSNMITFLARSEISFLKYKKNTRLESSIS